MTEAYLAYIDPGSGSLLLQLLVGSIIGAGIVFRQTITRVFRVFRRS